MFAFSNPTDAYTNADVAAMIPEIWTPIVNEAKFAPMTIANFVVNLSEFMTEGGDIAHVPDIYTNVFTVSTQSTQGNAVVDQSVAQVDTTLTVNIHKYIAWIIGDLTIAQLATKYSLNAKYASQARNLLIKALEDSLFALWSSISTNTVGDTSTVLTDLEIRSAISALDASNYELEDLAFFFHPVVFWKQISGISKYYDKSVNDMDSVVKTGNFGPLTGPGRRGSLYGVPVFVTSRVVSGLQTYRNLLLHESAFGYALQTRGGGMIRVQADYQLQNLGILTVADIIYGVGVLREPGAVLVNANTSATTS